MLVLSVLLTREEDTPLPAVSVPFPFAEELVFTVVDEFFVFSMRSL